jgi:hypothetical protein
MSGPKLWKFIESCSNRVSVSAKGLKSALRSRKTAGECEAVEENSSATLADDGARCSSPDAIESAEYRLNASMGNQLPVSEDFETSHQRMIGSFHAQIDEAEPHEDSLDYQDEYDGAEDYDARHNSTDGIRYPNRPLGQHRYEDEHRRASTASPRAKSCSAQRPSLTPIDLKPLHIAPSADRSLF